MTDREKAAFLAGISFTTEKFKATDPNSLAGITSHSWERDRRRPGGRIVLLQCCSSRYQAHRIFNGFALTSSQTKHGISQN